MDENGRLVTFREPGAVSSGVTQPILCFGKLLECGWGVDGTEQALSHPATGTKVPIELQNKSMMVRGWIRMVGAAVPSLDEPASCVRAVKASVLPTIEHGPIGWQLDQFGLGIGRHYSDHFQDPSLMDPNMTGARFRTTLVKDKGEWFVLELCEPLASLVDMTATFHEFG